MRAAPILALAWLAAAAVLPAAPPAATNFALHEVFRRYDTDADGFISPSEWARLAGGPADLPLDLDGDGRISESEFDETVAQVQLPGPIEVNPDAAPLLESARKFAAAGSLFEAERDFAAAANHLEGDPSGLLGQAGCLQRMGKVDQAVDVYRRAAERVPNAPETWQRLADALRLKGNDEEAREAAARASALLVFARSIRHRASEDSTAPATGCLCPVQREVRRLDFPAAVAAAAAAARARPDTWEPPLLSAALFSASGKSAAASSSLTIAESLGAPRTTVAALWIGLLLDRAERGTAVVELARLANSRCPARDQLEVAWQLGSRAEWRLAAPWLQVPLQTINGARAPVLLGAVTLWKVGDVEAAKQIVDSYMGALTPGIDGLPVMLRLCQAIGRLPKARTSIEQMLNQPARAEVWLALARAQGLAGDRRSQRQSLEVALERAPAPSAIRARVDRELAALDRAEARELPGGQPRKTAKPSPAPPDEPLLAPPGFSAAPAGTSVTPRTSGGR
ncbi:MAG: hypothetical protein HY303_08620 [Candidatus Wallbacteria bacterium]|nr:hypothetical protein [Candidatus Wallbacteria bacterium]